MLNNLMLKIHENAVKKGFWESDNISEKLMLIVTELSEACEALRTNKRANLYNYRISKNSEFMENFELNIKDSFEDELADSIIRILDLCGYCGIDAEFFIVEKMRYNKSRSYKHGKEF